MGHFVSLSSLLSDVSLKVVNGTRSQQPYSTFPADSPFIKSESAWVAQTYGRSQNYTKLRRTFRSRSCANRLAKLAKGNFGKSKQAIFCAKQANFAQTGHTGRRAELCVAALQADSLSTCCEWQKRDRTNKSFVILYKTGFIALSRFCHSQHVHTKNPPAVPRHIAPPGAVCGLFAQNLSVLRKKLPVSICQNLLWPVCTRFAAKCPHQLRIVLWPTIRLRIAQPRPIPLDKRRISPEMSNRAVGIGCVYNSQTYARQRLI